MLKWLQLDLGPIQKDAHENSALDGGLDGLNCFRVLFPQIAILLGDSGVAFLEIGAGQGEAVASIGMANKLRLTGSFNDLSGQERCLQFRKEK